jgi:hypothetical protein
MNNRPILVVALITLNYLGLISDVIAGGEPLPELHKFALQQNLKYFQLRETEKYQEAYAFLTEKQKKNISPKLFATTWRTVRKQYGRLVQLRVRKVTEYDDPESASQDRFIAIDYQAAFERMPVFCGYLVWRVRKGKFELQREEFNLLKNISKKEITQSEKTAAFSHLHCR